MNDNRRNFLLKLIAGLPVIGIGKALLPKQPLVWHGDAKDYKYNPAYNTAMFDLYFITMNINPYPLILVGPPPVIKLESTQSFCELYWNGEGL